MTRTLLKLHRYLGVVGGALMLMWRVTGFVMMYVSYPRLDQASRLAALPAIAWRSCCQEPTALPSDEPSDDWRVEMLANRPVLSRRSGPSAHLIDLTTGRELGAVSEADAREVARAYGGGARGNPRLLGLVNRDQWTVAGPFPFDRPLYRFALDDAVKTEVYVSSVTGQIVQATSARERFWNWLGSIPHWLYLFELRRRPKLWQAVVIATSLLGCFLTLTGLYIGWQRWPARSAPVTRRWHHASGALFGLFTLTWVGSGLLSVEPWGLLTSARVEPALLRGPAVSNRRALSALQAVAESPAVVHAVSLDYAPFDGTPYFIASSADGTRTRLDALGQPAPLLPRDFAPLAARLASTAPIVRLTREDRYLFSHHHDRAVLPAYRMTLDGARRTLVYFDATSGAVQAELDANGRAYRWIQGLHRFDLTPWLRARPLWDVLVLTLLSGVTVVCATGCWLAYRKRSPTPNGYL